jgi:hypothetical protein
MSPEKKTEKKAFLGQDELRCKIIVDNKCSRQPENFKYFHCGIAYENEKDVQQKLSFFNTGNFKQQLQTILDPALFKDRCI